MLFVFGFNAKRIRKVKLGELVHNSKDKKNHTNSQVSSKSKFGMNKCIGQGEK